MANLSLSWESASIASRASSPGGRARSPMNLSASPIPKAEDTATILAFRNARDMYRKSLSEKDLKRIMLPTGPEHVVREIENWDKKHLDCKFGASIRSGLGRLQRFSASIDMLAQGTPSPGCLLWGSIKFVLTIVQDTVQAYEQLCKALVRMIDCLPRIEIYTETFLESDLVAECVNAFFVSAIRFWSKACKFYSRRRLWRVLHVIWNDFNGEFGDLETDMIRNRDRVEGAALAEHIGESKVAKVNQQTVNSELLKAQVSERRREITAWLAPVAYDVEYFSNDLVSARAVRHPKTCIWVLDKPEVIQLCDTSHGSLLWICANPGAGKTVLSSFLIDHFESEESNPIRGKVFYFFCKNTDVDKNTPTAVVRSLLYQLYKSVKDQDARQSLNDDLGRALDTSGQQRSVNYTVLWQLFSTHVLSSEPVTVILDALDECQDPKQLIEGLKELSQVRSVKVIVTSRKESHLHNELKNVPSIEIAPEDIDADIAAFVESKVAASSQLSHPLVRDLVITKLCNAHDGMFLWVYLVLKELKSCFLMAQVQDALAKLPTGLNGIYKSILQRLQKNLTRSSLDLCSKILTWVVSAIRPLRICEIRQAFTLHYEMEGDTLLTDDRSFPYSDKDLELICGSLVTIRKGTLQVIHLTVKEFLGSLENTGGSTSSSLFVDPEEGSLQLTLVCLRCISRYSEPLIDLESQAPKFDWTLDPDALEHRRVRAPLLEYASFSWLVHLIDCKLDDLFKITPIFQETFSSLKTFSWVEYCMASQPDSKLRLLVGFDEVRDRFYSSEQDLRRQQSISQFLDNWCIAMSRVFEEYGAILARRPWEIYFIDLGDIFSADLGLQELWQEFGEMPWREKDLYLNKYQAHRPQQEKQQPHLQLQQSLQVGSSRRSSVFLVHDEARSIYIWGETTIESDKFRIFVQHNKTGRRLPPAEDSTVESSRKMHHIDHAMSPNGRHLVLFYSDFEECGLTLVWRINEHIGFEKRMNRESWARVVLSHVIKYIPMNNWYRAVMFEDDYHCITPSGRLDLLTGNRRAFPDGVYDSIGFVTGICSRNGRYLLVFAPQPSENCLSQARQVDGSEPIHFTDFCWSDKTRRLVDASPTGRYLVLENANTTFGVELEEEILYLYDTNCNETIELRLPKPLKYSRGKFHFSRDETRLIAFLASFPGLTVMIWDCLGTAPRLTSHAESKRDLPIHSDQIHVSKAAKSAIIVTDTRSIQRIELGDSIKLPDASTMIDDYPHRLSVISGDCSHWALVCFGSRGGKVQIIDLMSSDASARHFDLEWSQNDISEALAQGTSLPTGISPDLRTLVIDAEVFDLAATNDNGTSDKLTLASFTMEAAPALLKSHRHQLKYWGLHCKISPCNSYVVYMNQSDQFGRSRNSPAIFLFRIDLQNRTSARLELMLPEQLCSLGAFFHPSLPLMTITYGIRTSTEVIELGKPPPQYFAICDLESLDMTTLEIGKGQPTDAVAKYWNRIGWLPLLLFSDCGTFAYLEGGDRDGHRWFQKVHQMDINPVPFRRIDRTLSSDNSLIVLHDDDNASVTLELIKFDETGFRAGTSPVVHLGNIASYSSRYADAKRYLLLGATDEEKMRLFIVPNDGSIPVIKTLSLTFAEARSRLQKEWERLCPNDETKTLESTHS